MDFLLVAAVFALALAVSGGVFVLWRELRAPPTAEEGPTAEPVPGFAPRLAECERRLDSLFALRAEWGVYQEIVDDALEGAEQKRRRAAASASKRGAEPPAAELNALLAAAGAEGPSTNLASITDRAELRRRAHAAGKL